MAVISWETIIATLGKFWVERNQAKNWSGWISGDGENRSVTVTNVSFELTTGLQLEITDTDQSKTKYKLKAIEKGVGRTEVFLDGNPIEGAALIFEPKFTLTDLSRFAFDFRPIPLNGNKARFNMRFDTQ